MSLDGPDSLTDRERAAVEELLFRMADDEYVVAERYIEWQIYAPTLESDLAISNIAQDEFGHARLWYDLLQDMGYTEAECIWERDPGTWTHSTLGEQPFENGDWADVILRSYLYDVAENLRMEALVDSAYPPIADRVAKVLAEERYHREHAQSWLERLSGGEHHDKLQAAVDRLFPYALTLFAAGPHEEDIVSLDLRTERLADLREEWLDIVVPFLESLDVVVPEPDEVDLPEATGRDGSHTDAWFDLQSDFTHTYHELDLAEPIRLRGEG